MNWKLTMLLAYTRICLNDNFGVNFNNQSIKILINLSQEIGDKLLNYYPQVNRQQLLVKLKTNFVFINRVESAVIFQSETCKHVSSSH